MKIVARLLVLTLVALTVLVNVIQSSGSSSPSESVWSRLEADYRKLWYEGAKTHHPEQYYWAAIQTNRAQEAKSALKIASPAADSPYDRAYVEQMLKAGWAEIQAGQMKEAVARFETVYQYDVAACPRDTELQQRDLSNLGVALYFKAVTAIDETARLTTLRQADEKLELAEKLVGPERGLKLLTVLQNRQMVAEARHDGDAAGRLKQKCDQIRAHLPVQAPLID